MKAIGLYKYLPVEHEECLVEAEVTTPEAKGYDLLVKVKAVSVNPVDTKIRAPKPRVEDQLRVLGWDACGEVVQVGEQCTRFKQGDKVFYAGSITRPGSNSQYQLVDERIVGKKPESLSYEQAVALPLTSLTAWEALFERMDLTPRPSERNDKSTLLIIGGAGGVGSIATQLAKRVAKTGTVITTASRKESREWCGKMGADFSIDHNKPLMEQLNSKGISGVDYIFCCSATEHYFDQMAEIINLAGDRIVLLSADDNITLPVLSIGGKGVISVVANIVPEETAGMVKAWEEGNIEKAKSLFYKLFPLCKAMFYETNPVPVKTSLFLMGRIRDELRLPLAPLSEANLEKLKKALRDYGLI